MYVDEVYYHDMFKGEPVDDADFPALCQRAGEIIEEMTLYRFTEEGFAMMPENTQKLVKNAVCAQIEYLDANGGAEMDMGNQALLDASTKTETAGKLYRVYEQKGAFKSKANAEALQKKLQKEGKTAVII